MNWLTLDGAAATGGMGTVGMIIYLVVIFGAMYLLLIRPHTAPVC